MGREGERLCLIVVAMRISFFLLEQITSFDVFFCITLGCSYQYLEGRRFSYYTLYVLKQKDLYLYIIY